MIRFTAYRVIAEKLHVGQLGRFFHAPCRKNCVLDQKMNPTSYDGLDELYHHAKFGADRTMRAGGPTIGLRQLVLTNRRDTFTPGMVSY